MGSAPPPDGGWGWAVVAGSFCAHVVILGTHYSSGVFLVAFLNFWPDSDASSAAWVASLPMAMVLIGSRIVGPLTARYGPRRVTLAGAVIAVIGLVATSFTQELWQAALTFGVVTGAGFSLSFTPSILAIPLWFEKRRALAIGLAVSGSGVGTFAVAPAMTAIIAASGWRIAVLWLALGAALCLGFAGSVYSRPALPEAQAEPAKARPAQLDSAAATLSVSTQPAGLESLTATRERMDLDGRGVSPARAGAVAAEAPAAAPVALLSAGASPSLAVDQTQTDAKRVTGPADEEGGEGTPAAARESRPVPDDAELGGGAETPASGPSTAASTSAFRGDGAAAPSHPGAATAAAPEATVWSVLIRPDFLPMVVACFIATGGYNGVFAHLVNSAKQAGIAPADAAVAVGVLGGLSTVGRILAGRISDSGLLSPRVMWYWSLLIGGVSTMLVPVLETSAVGRIAYAVVFGLCAGNFIALMPVATANTLGVELLPLGMAVLFSGQAIPALVGAPSAGAIAVAAGSYVGAWMFMGGLMLVGGLFILVHPEPGNSPAICCLCRAWDRQQARAGGKQQQDSSGAGPSEEGGAASKVRDAEAAVGRPAEARVPALAAETASVEAPGEGRLTVARGTSLQGEMELTKAGASA
ncbi:hypothetical protein FNF31_01486 [Cafeteria roenbergensis]|uniref:Major facilitator superfamily (MFS) profile domain-containing protein n=1 Tax=Cafeteria roenbergensis TaxID=33653 RepID=A0A5A8E0S1_CAFRO|nr:hypothetical protein FNF31_01486 [Cafeteria roenbergensis]KAA0169531.1 hypothetical protein FNF28_01976 [Cafeteria roenbergensis]